jgi:tRNA(Arg) A34 adenosine deaminase TadA
MKTKVLFVLSFFISSIAFSQTSLKYDSIPSSYFVTHSRAEYIQKLIALPFGIKENDSVIEIIHKIENFLLSYKPQPEYPDDLYAKESNLQALYGLKGGGYGIGAILIDSTGRIIAKAHNTQIQEKRSDFHAEMKLLSEFEDSHISKKYKNLYSYKPGLTVFSSTEPCPMCFIRLSIVGVNTKYCSPGPDDGMVNRVECLPVYWRDLAKKYKFYKGKSSPLMQKTAHLLFFSYLIDNRFVRN